MNDHDLHNFKNKLDVYCIGKIKALDDLFINAKNNHGERNTRLNISVAYAIYSTVQIPQWVQNPQIQLFVH